MNSLKEELSVQLFRIGAIKFGEFVLSSGKKSPIYVDLRLIVSFPEVLDKAINAYTYVLEKNNIKPKVIVGVAVGGLPIASILSYRMKVPMVYVREKEKKHGTKRKLEGILVEKGGYLIVDDVATTGTSILRASRVLEEEGIKAEHAVVLVDREQGSKEKLSKEGITLYSFIKIKELIEILKSKELISEQTYQKTIDYLG